jgi:hypothetical protein
VVSELSGRGTGSTEASWEAAWRERYEGAPTTSSEEDEPARMRRTRNRTPLRHLVVATAILGVTVSSLAVAQTGGQDSTITAARGEGDPITLGDRNPGSGESTRETAIVANAGDSGLVLRPSNTAKGGRAVSATCDNDGQAAEDGCAVYVNKGTGAAASFRTQGSVPFALRETNTGRVPYLNADMLDGQHADAFLGRNDRAADAARLEGNPASAFLGATAKAADSEALDGRDSSDFLAANGKATDANALDGKDSGEFLGSTAKAADANLFDGRDSYDFTRVSGGIQDDGDLIHSGLGFTVFSNTVGKWDITFPAGTFAPAGESCSVLVAVVTPFGTTGNIANIETSGCLANGGGRFTVRTINPAGGAADVGFLFIVDAFD